MKRGDVVTVIMPGSYGKPRPAIIYQADVFNKMSSVTILPLTSHIVDLPIIRPNIEPGPDNGLAKRSQVMIDKINTVPKAKIDQVIGKISQKNITELNRSLIAFLGIG